MIYRQANHEDLSYLGDIDQALEAEKPDSPYWEPMSFRTHPLLPVERVTVADDNGKIAGTVGAIPLNAESWYLVNLYVLPEYRGNGVAKKLIEQATKVQQEAGRTSVIAIVADKVGNLYDKLGFSQVGRAMAWRHE